MVKLYDQDEDHENKLPEAPQWVKVTMGMYKDDVGIVEKVLSNEEIYVRLIPRLDPSDFIMNRKN